MTDSIEKPKVLLKPWEDPKESETQVFYDWISDPLLKASGYCSIIQHHSPNSDLGSRGFYEFYLKIPHHLYKLELGLYPIYFQCASHEHLNEFRIKLLKHKERLNRGLLARFWDAFASLFR